MYASCTIFFPFACDYIIVAVCFSCDKTYSFVAFDLMAMWTVEDIKKEIADINAFLGHRKAGGQINDLETSMQKGILAKIDAVSLSPADSLLLYKQIDESSSFSTAMKNTLKEQVDQTLTKPTQTQGPQVTLKPQTISLPKYLTKEEWNIVLTGQNYHEKVNTLVGRLVQLGLKSLSEKSVKSATACLFCSLSTLPDALAKYQMVQDVKLAFTSKACTGSDMPFILTYPEEPDTLSPVVLAKAYSGGTSPSGFVPPEYSKMLHMVILRDTHKEIRKAKAQANTPAPAPTQPQSQPQPENNRALDMLLHMVGTFMHGQGRHYGQGSPPHGHSQKSAKLALGNGETGAPPQTPKQAPLSLQDIQPFEPKLRCGQPFEDPPKQEPTEQSQAKTSSGAKLSLPLQGETKQSDGKHVEEAAFAALKNRQAAAKASAKASAKGACKPKAKAKGKAKAKAKPTSPDATKAEDPKQSEITPAAKAKAKAGGRQSKRTAAEMEKTVTAGMSYTSGEPEDRWEGKLNSWTSKHYKLARQRAADAGASEEEAKAFGSLALHEAKAAYLAKFPKE